MIRVATICKRLSFPTTLALWLTVLAVGLLAPGAYAQEAPTDLSVQVEQGVALSWAANSESKLAGYDVYRHTSSFSDSSKAERITHVLPADNPSHVDQKVQPDAKYFYRVAAILEDGSRSTLSNEVSAITPLGPPSNVNAAAQTGAVDLSWEAPSSANHLAGYQVYRSNTSFKSQDAWPVLISGPEPIQPTNFTDSNVEAGTEYYYQIMAVNTNNIAGMPSEEALAVPNAGAPAIPTGLTVSPGETGVQLSWDANSESGVTYNVYRSSPEPFEHPAFAQLLTSEPTAEASFVDTSVEAGAEYHYRVTAVNADNAESALSQLQTILLDNTGGGDGDGGGDGGEFTRPAAPSNLVATAGTGKVKLSWSASADTTVSSYIVFRSTTSFSDTSDAVPVSMGPTDELTAADTTFVDESVISGNTYYYSVVATDNSWSFSPLSNQDNAKPTSGSDAEAPSAPSELAVTDSTSDKGMILSWTSNTEEDLEGYVLYRSKASFENVDQATVVNRGRFIPDTMATFADHNVVADTTYYYHLTAVDSSGNESSLSKEASATYAGSSNTGGGGDQVAFIEWLPENSTWTSDNVQGEQSLAKESKLGATEMRTPVYSGTDGTNGKFQAAGYIQSNAFYDVTFTDPSGVTPGPKYPMYSGTDQTAMNVSHNPVFTLEFKIDPNGPGISYMVVTGELKSVSYSENGTKLTLKVAPVKFSNTPNLPALSDDSQMSGLQISFFDGNFNGKWQEGPTYPTTYFSTDVYISDIRLPAFLAKLDKMAGVQVTGKDGEEAKVRYYFDAAHAQQTFKVSKANEIVGYRETGPGTGKYETISPDTAYADTTNFTDASGNAKEMFVVDMTNDKWSAQASGSGSGTGSASVLASKTNAESTTRVMAAGAKSETSSTPIAELGAELPEEFALHSAYPNPFNPTTNLSYSLPKDAHVRLHVYDVQGRRVATLVDKRQAAGKKTVQFNASNLPSGLYLVRMQAEQFTATQSVILLK